MSILHSRALRAYLQLRVWPCRGCRRIGHDRKHEHPYRKGIICHYRAQEIIENLIDEVMGERDLPEMNDVFH